MRTSLHVWFCLSVFESPACMNPGWSSGAVGAPSLLMPASLMAPKAILFFPLLLLVWLLSPSITHQLCPLGVRHPYPRSQQSSPGMN